MPVWTCHLDHDGDEIVMGEEPTAKEALVAMYAHQAADHNAWHDATPIDLFPGPPDPGSVAPRPSPAVIASREALQLHQRTGSTV